MVHLRKMLALRHGGSVKYSFVHKADDSIGPLIGNAAFSLVLQDNLPAECPYALNRAAGCSIGFSVAGTRISLVATFSAGDGLLSACVNQVLSVRG